MDKSNINRYINMLINTTILLVNLYIINVGIKTSTDTLRWSINALSILVYIIWLYFLINRDDDRKIKITKINLLIGLSTITLLGIFSITMFSELIKENGVENVLYSYGKLGKFLYFTICYLQPIILPLPEPLTISAGNAVFGTAIGFTLGFLGTILGIITMFLISRIGIKKLNLNLISEGDLEKYNNLVEKNEAFVLILLFIFPILPDEIICIGAGLSNIKFKKFLTIALFSKLITVGIYSISTGFLKDIMALSFPFQLAIVILISFIFIILKKLIKSFNKNNLK